MNGPPGNERRPGESTEAATMSAGSGIRCSVQPTPDGLSRARRDPQFRAAEILADAWGPALERSYRLGRADGYTAGRWDAEHEMAQAWHRVWLGVKATLDQPTRDELARRRAS